MIKVRGIGGKTHIASTACCDEKRVVTICATRLRGDFSRPEPIDGPVNCTWCATRTDLLKEAS